MISVVCPFYNEAAIIEKSVELMLSNLQDLEDDWELIIVNDGSKDDSEAIARKLEDKHERLRLVSYTPNRGRGYAIRAGVRASKGDPVITTEIDSSWGDDIVQSILKRFEEVPDADIVIASPHLPGGGYRNVPPHRVFLSTFGNYIIRSGLTYDITMNTGMTRGYRREKFLALPLQEDEKEQHLEIVNKALAFGYTIVEVPAILEWKDHKLTSAPQPRKRKSAFKLGKLVRTHVLFSMLAAPFRYLYSASATMLLAGLLFLGLAVAALFEPDIPSIYYAIVSFFMFTIAFLVFSVGVLAQQNRSITRETWRIESHLVEIKRMLEKRLDDDD